MIVVTSHGLFNFIVYLKWILTGLPKMPTSCRPVVFTLSSHDPHRIVRRLTADHITSDVTFSIPLGPWDVFMFAAIDSHGEIADPFVVTWSSSAYHAPHLLFPKRWYSAPPHDTITTLHLHHSHPVPYGIILLLVRSANLSHHESKPLSN